MPATLPCPNPVCTHVFNAEAVMGAASLTCPRCGTKLEFRAPAPPVARTTAPPAKAAAPKPPAAPPKAAVTARPAAPIKPPARAVAPPPPAARPAAPSPPPLAAPPVSPPPIAAPVAAAPAIPLATPVTTAPTAPSALVFNSKPDVLLTQPRRRRGLPGWLIALLLVGGVFGGMAALVVGAMVNGVFWSAHPADPSGLSAEEVRVFAQQGNFRFEPPPKPWQADRNLRSTLGAGLSFRRTGPASSLSLVFRDYQTRQPREAELIDEALNKLRAHFADVEYEVKPKDEQSKLGGQPAVRLEFQGEDSEHVPVHGECVTTAYRGFAYWFFTWAPVDDAAGLADEWAGLREKFAVGDQREGWSEKPPKTAVVQGNKLPYKLDYIESVWDKQQDADKYGPFADAVLLGYDPKDKDARAGANAAKALVLALDKAADLPAAVKEAKDALMEIVKEKQSDGSYLFDNVALDPVTDKGLTNTDSDLKVGGFDGHVAKFEAKSSDQSRYVVVELVKMDEGVLAVVCECDWDRRDFWDQEFTALLAKLRPGKGK